MAPSSRTGYAAWSRNSTFTASKGNSILPSSVRLRSPADSKAVTSPCTAFTSRFTRRAASRMDTGPAPQSALMSAQRFAVSTRQSSSGVAKLMRAALAPWPLCHARLKSAIAVAGGRTSRVTVFTMPPRNVGLESLNQAVRVSEGVATFFAAVVPMIAFARFVIVPEHALTVDYVGQAVFESMIRSR